MQQISAWHVPQRWATIGPALAKAIERDPQRDVWTVLDQAMSADLDFWQVANDGYLVTQQTGRTFWVIYVAGRGGSIAHKRELMEQIEQTAKAAGCSSVKFEGRDWRKVFPDYSATKAADGRWHFVKRF